MRKYKLESFFAFIPLFCMDLLVYFANVELKAV